MYKSTNPDNASGGSCCDRLDTILTVITAIAVLSLVVREFLDADIWWQIAIGRDILNIMTIPRIDHYAAAALGRSYHDSHWLFQVVLGFADNMGGLTAVGLVHIAVWSATLFLSFRSIRNWASPAISCLLVFVVAIACNYRFMPRPEIVTSFMIALYYLRLQSGTYKSLSDLALLALLQVIWSNSHGLFVIGPFMSSCYLLESLINKNRDTQVVLSAVKLCAVLLLASLCTPFGLDGWRYAFQLAQEAGPAAQFLYKNLNELAPIFSIAMLSNPDFWGFVLLLAALAATIPALLQQRSLPISRMLIAGMLLLAAMSGRRNIPLFALVAAPLIAENVSLPLSNLPVSRQAKQAFVAVLLLFSLLALSGRYYQWFNYNPLRFGIGAPTTHLPTGFPAFLRQIQFTGQIYNNDLLGGFCLYHGILPLVDGRWEVYDQTTLNRILRAPFDQKEWDWMVSTYNIRGVLLENGSDENKALVPRLLVGGMYRLAYSDAVSSFWVRSDIAAIPDNVRR